MHLRRQGLKQLVWLDLIRLKRSTLVMGVLIRHAMDTPSGIVYSLDNNDAYAEIFNIVLVYFCSQDILLS